MTDITLGLPTGAFYWRGYIPGSFCGAQIDWECDYSSTEPVAIPPFIDYIGQHVVVTNWLPECESVPSYVSPGVLTLTPTVTCPNPDPEQPPIVTVLEPLYLTITEGGCSAPEIPVCYLDGFPENPGFETGSASGWSEAVGSVVGSPVFSGINAFQLSNTGGKLRQRKSGYSTAKNYLVTYSFRATAASATAEILCYARFYNASQQLEQSVDHSKIALTNGVWSHIVYPFSTNDYYPFVEVGIEATAGDPVVDDIALDCGGV